MRLSPAYARVRTELNSLGPLVKARYVLLEAGFYAWGGYEGTLWVKKDGDCYVLVGIDHGSYDGEDAQESVDLKIKRVPTECQEFERLWTQMQNEGVWKASSQLSSIQTGPTSGNSHEATVMVMDGAVYFLTVHSEERQHLFGVYEPCRLKPGGVTEQACGLMRIIGRRTEALTGVEVGPVERVSK